MPRDVLQRLLKEYRLSLPTPEDELQDLQGRLLVNSLVLCSRQLLSYEKATVTRQKEYACEQLTRGEIRRVAIP
jgi:hypothetical protein